MKKKKTILFLTLFSLVMLGMGFSLAPSLRKANFTPGESEIDLKLSDASSTSEKLADAGDNSSLSEARHSEAAPSVRKNRQVENENIMAVSSNGKNVEQNKTHAVSEKRERKSNDDGTGGSAHKGEVDYLLFPVDGIQNHSQEEDRIYEISSTGFKPGEKKTLTKLEKWKIEMKKNS